MKPITILFVMLAMPAYANPVVQPGTGCVWSESRGMCMVANQKDQPAQCDIRVQVTTNKNQKTTKVQTVIKPNGVYHTPQFRSSWDDKIERAQVAAKCK